MASRCGHVLPPTYHPVGREGGGEMAGEMEGGRGGEGGREGEN